MSENDLTQAEAILHYTFNDKSLLERALVHASLADHRLQSNERLEFLGDAVLGFVVCEHLFQRFDQLLEGELTKIKSSVVSRRTCADIAIRLGLDDLLSLGKGMTTRSDIPRSLAAAVYESLIGAIYIDGGFEVAQRFILDTVGTEIDLAVRLGHQHNFKSILQQYAQQNNMRPPQYLILDEQGPDHSKCFEVCVELNGKRCTSHWGGSKKQAEQGAALEALLGLDLATRSEDGHVWMVEELEEVVGRNE